MVDASCSHTCMFNYFEIQIFADIFYTPCIFDSVNYIFLFTLFIYYLHSLHITIYISDLLISKLYERCSYSHEIIIILITEFYIYIH